jgi:DDE superfamily endonuclease
VSGWTALLGMFRSVFTTPGLAIFADLLTGWVLTPGRRTITAMITVGDPGGRRVHDAYHRFVRDGAWSMSRLWRVLAVHAVTSFAPTGVVPLDCDDAPFHKDRAQRRGRRRVPGRGALHRPPGRVRVRPEPGRGHPASPTRPGSNPTTTSSPPT